jgi:hypothetical protein
VGPLTGSKRPQAETWWTDGEHQADRVDGWGASVGYLLAGEELNLELRAEDAEECGDNDRTNGEGESRRSSGRDAGQSSR